MAMTQSNKYGDGNRYNPSLRRFISSFLSAVIGFFALLSGAASQPSEKYDHSNLINLPFCKYFAGREGGFIPRSEYKSYSEETKRKINISSMRYNYDQASYSAAELAFSSVLNFNCKEAFWALEAALAYLNAYCEGETRGGPCRSMPPNPLTTDAAIIINLTRTILCSPSSVCDFKFDSEIVDEYEQYLSSNKNTVDSNIFHPPLSGLLKEFYQLATCLQEDNACSVIGFNRSLENLTCKILWGPKLDEETIAGIKKINQNKIYVYYKLLEFIDFSYEKYRRPLLDSYYYECE